LRLYNLGKVPWDESQLIYHALGALGIEALSLVSPATPYVSIGFHQNADREVDMEYCRAKGIPVFRREVGGGAVYLDGHQLFFQLILRKDNPLAPARKESFYRKFLEPVVNVYRRIGIEAVYKPINDVIAGTRKISGTGAGEIGDCVVFVGNLIVDFDYETMCRVLRVPDEKFRDKVHKTLRENLSTIRRELGEEDAGTWDDAALNALMAEEFQKILGPMEAWDRDDILHAKIAELRERMLEDAWLYRRGRPAIERDIKIRAGVEVRHRMHKAPGGLIRADFEMVEGAYGRVRLSGDFFCFPEKAVSDLEALLQGKPFEELESLLKGFYEENRVETPGVSQDDWRTVLGP